LRTCNRAFVSLVALVVLLGVVMVAGNSSLVSADSCTAQLGYPTTPTTYYASGFQMVIPVSATCSFSGNPLYAVGNVYDTSTNTNLGSANTVLTSVDGGNVFNGQLLLTLPVQGDTLQVIVSIYSNGPNGSLLTTATQTLQVNGANYSYPGYYWYYPWSPSYPSYPSHPSYPSPGHHDPSPPPGHHDDPTPPSPPPGHHDYPTPPHH